MACCAAKNFQPDCAGLCDSRSRHWVHSVTRGVCRVLCGVFCWFSKWSPTCCHHTLMAVCAVLAAISATVSSAVLGVVNDTIGLDGSVRCILFAKFEGVKLITSSRTACIASSVGESVVAGCMLLLVVWFVVKARCGVGWKAEMWSSLVQIVALTVILVLSGISTGVVTVGLQRTCGSLSSHTNTTPTFDLIDCIQLLPVYLSVPNGTNAKLLELFYYLTMAMVVAGWIVAVLVFILLAASVLSILIHQYRTCVCIESYRHKGQKEQSANGNHPTASDQQTDAVEVPRNWSPQSTNYSLFELHRGSIEWNHVQSLVHATIPKAEIQSLERVQNKWLWEKYLFAKQRLSKKNRGIVNEKELFHGTRSTPPDKILKSEHGFDFRLASQGMWGEGTYFAVKASYSGDSFGYRKEMQTQIILAKVLTGDTYQCQPNRALKRPPQKPHSSISARIAEDEHYDSVSGVTGGSDIFVVYDHDKAYPAYLITYSV